MLMAHAIKRVAAGAHLPTPWLFQLAKCSDDKANYFLEFIETISKISNVDDNFQYRDFLLAKGIEETDLSYFAFSKPHQSGQIFSFA